MHAFSSRSNPIRSGKMVDSFGIGRQASFYDRIGLGGLVLLVWRSTPLHLKPFIPYGIMAYKGILEESYTIDDLFKNHCKKYAESLAFRLFRPRYNRARYLLDDRSAK